MNILILLKDSPPYHIYKLLQKMRFFLKVTGEETFDKISSILALVKQFSSQDSSTTSYKYFFSPVSVFYVFVELFFPITGGSEYKKHFRWP
jgi:hypothetical protein